MTSNPYELAGRLAKARKIVETLTANGYRSGTVAGFSDDQWSLVAAAARVKHPSVDTQALVISLLRDQEGVGAR